MKHRIRKMPDMVIYDLNAKCLDLDEFSGFFSRRKKNRLYESIMGEISCMVLDVFEEVETFTYGLTVEGFHILVWTARDGNRIARIMTYVRSRFEEKVNRSLDRTGPVWDGTWTCDIIKTADCE
jgi:hypothetical protein